MSDKLQLVKTLLRDIRADDEHYQALRKLLESQRLCMIRRASDELLEVNEQIMQCYQALSNSTRARRTLLQQLGVTPDIAGVQLVFSWLPTLQRQAAETWWQQLERQAAYCKNYNEKNGELLTRQYEFVQAFLGNEPDFIYHP